MHGMPNGMYMLTHGMLLTWWSSSGVGRSQAAVGAEAIGHTLPSGQVMVAPPASVLPQVPERGSDGPPLGEKSMVIVVMPTPLQLPCSVYQLTPSSVATRVSTCGGLSAMKRRPASEPSPRAWFGSLHTPAPCAATEASERATRPRQRSMWASRELA